MICEGDSSDSDKEFVVAKGKGRDWWSIDLEGEVEKSLGRIG